jgi:hypothetical protein
VNCKPGDIAVAISAVPSKAHNIGGLVRIESAHERPGYWHVETLSNFTIAGVQYPPGSKCCAPDNRLRPIRGQDGEDETMTWAPRKETA